DHRLLNVDSFGGMPRAGTAPWGVGSPRAGKDRPKSAREAR
ncbi:MAG: hypothetical protein QOE58_145, partial [Actinomycetota bacterium]|nr:hypothetical protein [Actinomycetota bacterium]